MAPGINRTGKKWHPVIMDACRILKVLFALGEKKARENKSAADSIVTRSASDCGSVYIRTGL